MYQTRKIILVIDEQVTENDCQFGIKTIVNQGYRVEIFRLCGYFDTGLGLAEGFYRCAAELCVSPQQLDSDFRKAQSRHLTYGNEGVDLRDITFEEYSWQFVSRALIRHIPSLRDIACVIGTDQTVVNYLVDYLRLESNTIGIVVPKSPDDLQEEPDLKTATSQ